MQTATTSLPDHRGLPLSLSVTRPYRPSPTQQPECAFKNLSEMLPTPAGLQGLPSHLGVYSLPPYKRAPCPGPPLPLGSQLPHYPHRQLLPYLRGTCSSRSAGLCLPLTLTFNVKTSHTHILSHTYTHTLSHTHTLTHTFTLFPLHGSAFLLGTDLHLTYFFLCTLPLSSLHTHTHTHTHTNIHTLSLCSSYMVLLFFLALIST